MMTSYDTSFESVSHKLQDESYDVMIESLFRYFRFGAGVTSGRKFNFGFEAWAVEWWSPFLKSYILSKVSKKVDSAKKNDLNYFSFQKSKRVSDQKISSLSADPILIVYYKMS